MIDEELLKEFIIESGEHLSEFEVNMNNLIEEPNDRESLNQVFRAVHSIKGSADYLGLAKTGGFLHSLEGILERLRSGDMRLTKEVMDVLFLGMDTARSILDDLSEGKGELTDVSAVQEQIEIISGGEGGGAEPLELEEVRDEEVDIYEGLEDIDITVGGGAGKGDDVDIYEGLEDVDFAMDGKERGEGDVDIYEGLEDIDIGGGEEVGAGGREPIGDDFFDDDIEVVLKQHLSELEKSVKRLEDTKSHEELENFLKLISSFSTSIEYFGFDELNSILSGVIRTVNLMFEEGEKVSDTEVLYFYNTMDQIREFIESKEISEVAAPERREAGDDFQKDLSMDDAVKEFTIIPGVGASKAKIIYKAGIKSMKELSEARVEDLEAINGINLNLARGIRAYFKERGEAAIPEPEKPAPPREEPQRPEPIKPAPPKEDAPKPEYPKVERPKAEPLDVEVTDRTFRFTDEVKEDVKNGYDTELVDIFLTATVDLFSLLEVDLDSIRRMDADEGVLRDVLDVVSRLQRSAKYMEYENIGARLNEVHSLTLKYLQDREGFTKDEVRTLVEGLLELKEGLRKSKIVTEGDSAVAVDHDELSEEDKELVQIFLSAADQYTDTLSTCLAKLREGKDASETMEIYRKALESLRSSAKFMGYDSIIDNIEGQLSVLDKGVSGEIDGPRLFSELEVNFSELKGGVKGIRGLLVAGPPEEPEIEMVSFDEKEAPGVEEEKAVETVEKPPIEKVGGEMPEIQAQAPPVEEPAPAATEQPGGGAPPGGPGGVMPPGDDGEPPGTDFKYSKQTLRVETDRVDNIMNLVGELVVNRASFSQLLMSFREAYRELAELKKLDKSELSLLRQITMNIESSTVELGRVANELQEGVMRVRMVGINQLFSRFPRLVRDLADKMDKKVRLSITGRETELDKSVIEEIGDPLIHIIRNAIDHGIETVDERKKKKKPEVGTLGITAYHQGNQVIIEVADDGRGIDHEAVKDRMVEKGEITDVERTRITDREALNFLFKPGVSMSKKLSNVSGRGVGLDIVKKNIDKLNGSVDIISEKDVGTTFLIKLPLTLAIIQALIVEISEKNYSIPLAAVTETVRVNVGEIDTIEGHKVLRLRDKVLPLLSLKDIFKMNYGWAEENSINGKQAFVVVLSAEGREVGLIVDRLVGEEDIVIKSLEEYLSDTKGVSGASIMGDGSISLILDVIELVNLAIEKEKEMRNRQMRERMKRKNSNRHDKNTTPFS